MREPLNNAFNNNGLGCKPGCLEYKVSQAVRNSSLLN
jgi:hypothetical protein